MDMMRKIHLLYYMMAALMMVSCSETEGGSEKKVAYDESQVIKVGGVNCGDVVSVETRAIKGEENKTLKEVLLTGLDITYYLASDADNKKEARLTLLPDDQQVMGDSTKYTFYLKGTETPATWLGNGGHVFHGFSIPVGLAPDIDDKVQDQSDENVNDLYGTLESYLCMPPDHQIQATVAYVRLPFTHRLARVVGRVLIDPDLKGATVQDIYMENVKVLKSANTDTGPQWTTARKVIPHYGGYWRGDLYVYYNKKKGTYLYPTSYGWDEAHEGYQKAEEKDSLAYYGFTRTTYTDAPSYEIIVRPTYTDDDLVMYDEASGVTAAETNSVGFVVTLSNGLVYRKTVTVDLDANNYTIIYLRIAREKVDYESSGAEVWQMQKGNDGPYGLDNKNELRLSKAGGSWQRAYRIGTDENTVTDGNKYNKQYISERDWLEKLGKAVENGENWGDYFVLLDDLTIDTSQLPENFVFAGHLDGRGHTITLTGSRGYLFDGLKGDYEAEAGQANVHTETVDGKSDLVPLSGFRAGVMNLILKGGTLFSSTAEADKENKITGYVTNCTNETTE